MARGRGGPRVGTPGTAYSNRTDLNKPAFTGQQYGAGVEQHQIESTIQSPPAPALPAAPAPGGPPAPGPGGPPTATPAPYTPRPIVPLDAPTQRPSEPVTAGLSIGNGPGPEALGVQPPDLAGLLTGLARTSPDVAQLAAYVASGRR